MDQISFYRYAAIVKNLRGVLYWKGENGKLDWLLSRFRYRHLGLSPSASFIKGKNVVPLTYPTDGTRDATKILSRCMQGEAAEAMCLASVYISPLMTNSLNDFELGIVEVVRTSKKLDNKSWKLHMRIADYTILDLYAWSTNNAREAMESGKVEKYLEERKKRIKRDVRRYWRLADEEGFIFLAYIDPLEILYKCDLIDEFVQIGEDAYAIMGIVPLINLESNELQH